MISAATSRNYWQQVWNSRHFLFFLCQLDFRNRYRRTVLGIGWSLMNPICMMIVLCTVFHQIFNYPIRDHAPFVMAGVCIWTFLSASILEGCNCIYGGEKYIRSIPMPMGIYPLRVTIGLFFQFLIVLALTVLITLVLRGYEDPIVLLALLPSLVVLFFFSWAMGVLFGFANVYFPDTTQIASVFLQILFYLTPVFYPPGLIRISLVQTCLRYNPFAALVSIVREPLVFDQLPPLENYAYAVAVTALAVFLAVRLLAKCERTLIFHL
jgi:lipopolysaccharide transport system permease protein